MEMKTHSAGIHYRAIIKELHLPQIISTILLVAIPYAFSSSGWIL